jgi:TetR/AcrR family transcriptional regulator, copper-responsive repressor
MKRTRGRPRAYDPDTALAQAMGAFWGAGFSATSLDELAAATGMNRPSLYAAFGDKKAMYLETLGRYRAAGRAAMDKALAYDRPLAEGLRRVYASALDMYFPPNSAARGCFLIGTATTEAMGDPDMRAMLGGALRDFDAAFEARLAHAKEKGELGGDADPRVLAKIASAVLHSLAIRSRAGDPRAELEATADAGVAMICGTQRPPTLPRAGRGKRARR